MIPRSAILELARINEGALPDKCIIHTRTEVTRPGGVVDYVFVPDGVERPCRLSAVGSPAERNIADNVAGVAQWVLVLAYGTVIESQWRAVVTGVFPDGTEWTRTLEVVGSLAPQSHSAMTKVVCTEIRTV